MKVLMSATSFPASSTDWKGRFIYDMAASVAASSNVELKLWAPPGELPDGVMSALVKDDARWLHRLADEGGIASLLRQHPLRGGIAAFGLLRRLRRCYAGSASRADVIHANWIQNALPLWGSRRPALITVLGSDFGLLGLPGMVSAIRAMLKQRAAILAPNAAWMEPELTRLFGDLAEIRAIPFGVHARWFAIKREVQAVESGDWLMVSRVTRAKMGRLFEWGEGVFGPHRRLHLLGPMQDELKLPEWVAFHGASNPEDLATQWFPRARGLLTLSTHDEGRPQVMIEAMAAGLPVIATDLAAHRDLLSDGSTGYLVGSREQLVQALRAVEEPAWNRAVGEAARYWVSDVIGTWDDCAGRFVRAYADLLEKA